jgi:hypothetical protein
MSSSASRAIVVLGVLLLVQATFQASSEAGYAQPESTGVSWTLWLIVLFAAAVIGAAVIWLRNRQPHQPTDARPRSPEPSSTTRPTPTPEATSGPARTIFISYRRTDSADITGRIYDRLKDRFGAEHVYKDVDSVPIGVDFRKHVDGLVARCDALIAVIGNQWLRTEAGARDVSTIADRPHRDRRGARARDPVVPVLVGGAAVPPESDLPDDLRDLAYRNGIDVRPDPDFHKDLDRLIAGLETHFGR